MPKKKVSAKKVVAKKAKKKVVAKKAKKPEKASPERLFSEWWGKVAQKKVSKIEDDWVKENEPNDPEDDGGGDHWHVNELMHSGDASEMTYEIAEQAFIKGYNKENWELTQCESLYCDLDSVIEEAYSAGKKAGG